MEDALQNRTMYLISLIKLKREYEAIEKAEKEKVNLILPDEEDIPELFLMLDIIAKESGLRLTSISATEKIKQTGKSEEGLEENFSLNQLGVLDVTLSLSGGSYNKFKIFLDKVERNIRLLDIKLIGFEAGLETLEIALSTYFFDSNP